MPKKKPKDSITRSEKRGVNPTIPLCGYYDKKESPLIMLGKCGKTVEEGSADVKPSNP